mgnify:CR=1 FL=1
MSDCAVCGESSLGHRCRGCGESHCESHMLPENHDCVALYVEGTDGKWFDTKFETLGEDKRRQQSETKSVDEINSSSSDNDEPTPDPDKNYTVAEANADNPAYQSDSEYETVDVEEEQMYGTAEPEYESSPDVDLDGSIKSEDAEIEQRDDQVEGTERLSNLQLVLVSVVVLCALGYVFYLI